MKKFRVAGWIHPKQGGDDRPFELKITHFSLSKAKKMTEEWLKKRSCIVTDYTIKEWKHQQKMMEEMEWNKFKKEMIEVNNQKFIKQH